MDGLENAVQVTSMSATQKERWAKVINLSAVCLFPDNILKDRDCNSMES